MRRPLRVAFPPFTAGLVPQSQSHSIRRCARSACHVVQTRSFDYFHIRYSAACSSRANARGTSVQLHIPGGACRGPIHFGSRTCRTRRIGSQTCSRLPSTTRPRLPHRPSSPRSLGSPQFIQHPTSIRDATSTLLRRRSSDSLIPAQARSALREPRAS